MASAAVPASSLASAASSAVSLASSLSTAGATSSASAAYFTGSVLASAASATLYAPSYSLPVNTVQAASESAALASFQSSYSKVMATASVNPTDAQTTPQGNNSGTSSLLVSKSPIAGLIGMLVALGMGAVLVLRTGP